jgi:hypothetical protein
MAINITMARGNKNLKKANEATAYTHEQMVEFMKCREDPVYFCRNYVYIKHPSLGQILFDLYDYQEEMIRNYQQHKYNIVLSARQTGKTETTAAYLLWYSIFQKSKTVLIASRSSGHAMEIIERIQNAYEELPNWLKPGIDPNTWNKHNCKFENKSQIIAQATSENTGRGFSVSLLYCDEFAFVPYHVQKGFWQSIYPSLTAGEGCIISSTPNGDSDLFAELWRKSELEAEADQLTRHEIKDKLEDEDNDEVIKFHAKWIKWDMPPGRGEAFKKEKIHILGERAWLQEYKCEFLGGEGTLLDNKVLIDREKQITDSGQNVLFWIKDFPFFSQIKAGGKYIIGVDPSSGVGDDYSVIEVFEFPSLVQVCEYRTNNTRPAEMYGKLKALIKFLTNADCEIFFSIERNGVGEGMIALWENDVDFPERAEMFHDEGKNKYGFYTTDVIKLSLSTKLKMLHETNSISINSTIMIKELKNYVRRGRAYEARPGMTDDCVSALLIVIRVLEELAESSDEAHRKLYPVSISTDNDWSEDEIHVIDGEDDYMPVII